MASGGNPDAAIGDARAFPLDIDDVKMLLQVEQEQVQKRTFTNWINAQLSKRNSPSLVQDLFADLSDGTRLLDLLEVMSGQRLKREKGHGVFQQRGNVETALNFLKNKSIKLVNINIPDIMEGKPRIILGLIWTIILDCHIEELASTLSFGSRSSSLESLSSQDSAPGTPVRGSPVPRRVSPLHARFRLSAKKALLLWVRDQCRNVGCSVSVKDFKSSWRSGVAFLAVLCSLRPDLVDLSLTETRSNLQNLEETFCIAQQELGIPRLLEPEDIDISNPDEKSIMTYVAQFLQYSNDMPSAEDDLEASHSQKVSEMTCWLQRAYEDMLDMWSSTEGEGYAERYQAFQTFVESFYEQRRPVMSMLSAMKRSAKISEEQLALRKAWDLMEERLQQYRSELDEALPAPLHTVAKWLQNMEVVLSEEHTDSEDHKRSSREARDKQEKLKVLLGDMSWHLDTLHQFHNTEDDGGVRVPAEKLDEMKRRFTNARVTAKYHGIKLEYKEQWHHVQELLGSLKSKLKSWRAPYTSQEAVLSLMEDWHDTMNTQGLVSNLKAAIHMLKQTANTYTSKAALAEDAGAVSRQVKEAEREAEVSAEAAFAVRETLERVLAEWESYRDCSHSLQLFLEGQSQTTGTEQASCSLSEWSSCQARLNNAGNFLTEVTDCSTSNAVADELSRLNIKWADFIKRTKFTVDPKQSSSTAPCAPAAQMLLQEAGWTLREAVEVSSGTLRTYRTRLQMMMKRLREMDLGSLSPSPGFSEEALQKLKNVLPEVRETLSRVEQTCEGLQKGASLLEGRLAELDHWSTEALEVCQQLKEWQHKHQRPHPRVKSLISRGLQLEGQVVTESQDLQSLLENVQKSSAQPYLSISALQDRVKHTVKRCQETIEELSCLGVKREGLSEDGQPPPKVIVRAYSTPEAQTGTFQKHEAQACRVHQERLTQPQSQQISSCSQVQKLQLKAKPATQPHSLSLADPLKQPDIVRNKDVLLKQTRAMPSSPLRKESQTETETHPGSSVSSASSSQNVCSFQLMTSQQQKHSDTQSKAKPQTQTTTLHLHHGLVDKPQRLPQSLEASRPHVRASPQAQAELHTQSDTPTHTQLNILPQTPKHAQAQLKTPSPSTRQKHRGQGKTTGSAHVPGQTEVYSKAQAMARSRMERAKQHLHQHIEEVITIFSSRVISEEQAKRKKGALRLLRPAVLEEFLEAVEAVGAFCSEVQLRDMEHVSLSVRAQWEVVRLAIESFLPDLWREVQRRDPETEAVLKSELDTNTETPACVPDQVCSEKACSLIAEPRERLEALHVLSDKLRPSAGSCLATTHLRERRSKLENVQYHITPTSSTVLLQHSRGEQTQDNTLLRETELPADQPLSQVHSQGIVQADSTEAKQTPDTTVIHISQTQEEEANEGTTSQKAHSSHSTSYSEALRQQLQKNSERLRTEFPTSFGPSHASLSAHLQELQTLKQQTEALWSEVELQSSALMEESERTLLIQQWTGQQISFQSRMKSLESALELLEPVDVHLKLISDKLNQLLQKPLDITGFVLTDSTALKGDIKLLGEHIQRELRILTDAESKAANSTSSAGRTETELMQHTIQTCSHRLQQLKDHLGRAQTALEALEHLLPVLHQLDVELSTTPGTSVLPTSIKQRLQEAREEAVYLDRMLEDAGMRVTVDNKTGSCQEVVSTLFKSTAEMKVGAQGKEEEEQRERMLGRKEKALKAALREVQGMMERQGLKEPTLPALQHRLRCLADIESKLTALRSDIQSIQDASPHRHDLEALWNKTHTAVNESREECLSLTELLKRFQNCRSRLGGTLQRAEQTISDQASYMGRDNLQRLLTQVTDIKLELSALGDGVEEFRAVCRQLQSQMRKISDCPDAPFESEADALMDRWLDVSERTDCRLDSLQVGLSFWDKLLLLAREVDSWTTCKLLTLAQSQPFQTEEEIAAVQDELRVQEDNVAHFHRRSAEIQELLQSTELPLELQVIESQLIKRMEEVKELFSETSDVFRELGAAKAQVAASMTECMSSIRKIKYALSALTASGSPQFFQNIQRLSEQLHAKAELVEAVLHQLALLASVASPESLQTLTEDGERLQESLCEAEEMIMLLREHAESLSKTQAREAEDKDTVELNFKDSTVQRTQDAPLPIQPNLSDPQRPPGKSLASYHEREESPTESSDHDDVLTESTGTVTSGRRVVDVLDTDTQITQTNTEENLKGLLVATTEDSTEESMKGQIREEPYVAPSSTKDQKPRYLTTDSATSSLQQSHNAPENIVMESIDSDVSTPNQEKQVLVSGDSTSQEDASECTSFPMSPNDEAMKSGANNVQYKEAPQSTADCTASQRETESSTYEPTPKKVAKIILDTGANTAFDDDITFRQGNESKFPHDSASEICRPEVDFMVSDSDKSISWNPGSTKVFTIVLDVDQPVLKPDKPVESPEAANVHKFCSRTVPLYTDFAKPMDSKSEQTKCSETWSQKHSLDNLEGMQSVLPEAVEPGQAENVCTQQLQIPAQITVTSSSGEDDVLESSQRTIDNHQVATRSDINVAEAVGLESPQKVGKTIEHDVSLISSLQMSTSLRTQDTEIPKDMKTNEVDVGYQSNPQNRDSSDCSSSTVIKGNLDTNNPNYGYDQKIEASCSNQMSSGDPAWTEDVADPTTSPPSPPQLLHFAPKPDLTTVSNTVSSTTSKESLLSLDSSSTELDVSECTFIPVPSTVETNETEAKNLQCKEATQSTADFTASQHQPYKLNDSPEPKDLTTDSKQRESMDATPVEILNYSQTEDITDGTQATATRTVHVGYSQTSSMDPGHRHPLEIQSMEINNDISQEQSSDSAAIIHSHKLEADFTTTPSSTTDQPKATIIKINLKTEEMFSSESDVPEDGDAQSEGPKKSSMERQSSIQDQPDGPSGWTNLLDIITDVQPLTDTSRVSTDRQSRESPLFLEPSLTRTEKQLEQTVLRVLRCRYRPAQLNTELMTQQLQEAEDCRQCVEDQVAALSQDVGSGHSQQSAVMEGRWSAALLDASATVQVKEAQLHQITQYHQQKQTLQDTLQKLEAELDSLSLTTLESSAIRAEKLHAFLKAVEQKKGMLEELLRTCCQISTHLGEAEGPMVCLLQVKRLQEKWQDLEATADLSLRHAEICSSEASVLLKDAEVLLGDLASLQMIKPSSHSPESHAQSQHSIQRIKTSSDLVEMNARYLHLCELWQGMLQCPVGEKERKDIEEALQGVKSQLSHIQEKLGPCITRPGDHSVIEVIRDHLTWAKGVENKVSKRKKLSLFPDEANQQINSMKKLQSEISSRRSKVPSVVKKLREEIAGLGKEDSAVMLSALETLENLYGKISQQSDSSSAELYKMLYTRQRLESQITENSSWVSSLLEKESSKCAAVELVGGSTIAKLKVHHQKHKATLKEAEKRLLTVQTVLEESKDVIQSLNVSESFHLVNKLTTLRTEILRIVRRKRASCWELEELLHAQESSAEEFAAIQKSLRQMTTDFEKQRYPVTQESLSAFVPVRYMLLEHQSQVQEAQHCQEPRRKDLLHAVLTLQARARLLDQQAEQHEKYLASKKRLDTCSEAIRRTVSQLSDRNVETSKRLKLGQSILVELPMLKISCQETADQLETLSGDLYPSQLNSERQKIQSMFESLASWEQIVGTEVTGLERTLVADLLSNPTELSAALTEHFLNAEDQLKHINCLEPTDQSITEELRNCWTLKRSLLSVLRMLEVCKDSTAVESYGKATDAARRTLKECKMHMEKLLQAKEGLSDYLMAVRHAQGFLQQVEFRLLIPSASFKDCMEELHHTQQTQASLSKGFQAHMDEIHSRLPAHPCFSTSLTEKLQIQVISHMLVEDAILEAQIQLKLNALQRCLREQSSHRKHHDEVNQFLRNFDLKLSEKVKHKPAFSEECKDQLQDIKMLQEELESVSERLEQMRESCLLQDCNASADQTLDNLWRHWATLQRRLDFLKSRAVHAETEWKELLLRINKSRGVLEQVHGVLTNFGKEKRSLGNLKWILVQTEQLQDALDQEHFILVSLQRSGSNLQELSKHTEMSQDLQSLQSRCRSLREQSSEVRREVLSEIQEWGRLQEELKAVQQSVLSLLSLLQKQSDPPHLQEMKIELGSQNARLQEIMHRVKRSSKEPPQEIQMLQEEVFLCIKNAKEKVREAMESTNPLHRMSEQLGEVTVGLNCVQALLQKKSSTVKEAENTLKRVWDELDQWHSRIAELESEVQELAEDQPERAHMLMDELTKPLQFYQDVAKQAEQRTAFISRIPPCLQEYDDILHSSTQWLAEAQSWLDTPHSYTTAKCLHSHANSLQVVLDESEGIRGALEAFGPALEEISAVCDTSSQEQKLMQVHSSVIHMQRRALEPLTQLQHAAAEMDAIESEVKTIEKNLTKIRTILSTVDTEDIPLEEHLHNRQIILDNLQVMSRTIDEIERCRAGLGLPTGAEHSLSAFHKAQQLQQPIVELQQHTEEQSSALKAAIGPSLADISSSEQAASSSLTLQYPENLPIPVERPYAEEEDDYEDEGSHSSSSETLTCSVAEDPDDIEMDEEQTESEAVVQISFTEESSSKEETSSMESEPLKTETEPGNTISSTQLTRFLSDISAAEDTATTSVPTVSAQPYQTQIPVKHTILTDTEEEIREAETVEEPKYLTVNSVVQSVETGTQESSLKEETRSMEPGPLKSETEPRNAVSPTQLTIFPPDISVSEDTAIIRQDITRAETVEEPKDLTVNSVVKSGETETQTSAAQPGLKDKDYREESADMEALKVSISESPKTGAVMSTDICTLQQTVPTLIQSQSNTGPQLNTALESPLKQETRSMESGPLKSETEPRNAVSPTQLTIFPPDISVSEDTAIIRQDITRAETVEEPKDLTVNSVVKSGETETQTSAAQPGLKDKDNREESADMEALLDLPKTITDHLEGPISESPKTGAVMSTDIFTLHQTGSSEVSEPVKTSVPTLIQSHSDTDTGPQLNTALIQSELIKQKDLIGAIARHGSTSDLEQEEQTQKKTKKYAGSSSKRPHVPGQPGEIATARDTWTQLLLRLQALMESSSAEVTGLSPHDGAGDTGHSIMQEMLGYSDRLCHIRQSACRVSTSAAAGEEQEAVQSELCETLTGLSHSLASVTHTLLHTPSENSREAYQLQLLNLQCISAQLSSVSDEISEGDSQITEAFGLEASQVSSCLKCLQSYISSTQKALSSQEELLNRQLGHSPQLQTEEQLLENPVAILKSTETQQDDPRSLIQDQASPQTGQGQVWSSTRELQGSVGENAALQRCCYSLLQALKALLDLGSERVRNSQNPKPHSCTELQSLFRGQKKYLQELKRYRLMILHLSKKLPEGALQGQGEIEQLVTELLLEAHKQGSCMQQKIQEWCQYEEMKGILCMQLEELEAAMPSEALDLENEQQLEERLQAYQRLRGFLEDSRPQLGLLCDLGRTLQSGNFGKVGNVCSGSGLEANWLAFSRRLEYESQRTKEMRVNYDRFQRSSADLRTWMGTARSQSQMWNNPADSKLLLPKLMEFCEELESRSVQKAAAVKAGTQVMMLSDGEVPELHQHLTQLEQDWTDLMNTLPSVQHTLEHLLADLDHGEVLAELNSWLEHMEGRLEEEISREQHVQDSTELSTLVQQLKACKAEVTSRQPCLDFLIQSVEKMNCVQDSASHRNKRLILAEQLGNLSLRWTFLQGKIDSQIHEMDLKRLDCKNREEHLQRSHCWISEQEEKMRLNRRPAGWTEIEHALKDYEDEKRLNLKSDELLQLKSLHLLGSKDGQHPGDQAFNLQVDSAIQQWQALKQQMCAVQAALVRLKEQWNYFDTELRDAALHTANISSKLECSKSPRFSLQQTKEHVKELQELQMELNSSEEVWTKVSSLCSNLKDKIHPGAALLLSDRLEREKTRRTVVVQDVSAELQKAQTVLRLWVEYRVIYEDCCANLSSQWQQYEMLLSPLEADENRAELLHSRINAISVLENGMKVLQNGVAEVLVSSKPLIALTDSQAAALIQSETRLLSRDVVHLGQALARRRLELQEELEEHVSFNTDLASLEQRLKNFESLISSTTASTECRKLSLLEQSGLTPHLGDLNKRSLSLNLCTYKAKQLRVLNTQWVRVFSQATARHREVFREELCSQSFQMKCQAWMDLLEKVDSGLSNDISGNESSIREQLMQHQKLKMEVLIGQQLLDSVVNEALSLLENGQIVDRRDLILKLTQLKEQWQSTLHRVQKRSRSLEQLTDKWRFCGVGMKTLWKLLGDIEPILPPAGLPLCSLQQLQHSIQDYEQAKERLSLHEELYSQTIQNGRQIFLLADAEAQAKLSAELGALKEAWEQSHVLVEKRKTLTETIIQNWNSCETGLAESSLRLQVINVRLKQPLLDNLDIQEKLFKELEDSLELWAEGLRDLATMKADVSQYVLTTDAMLLQGQVEELHTQWEELCLKVSKRKQEIADRLNAWIIFNDKNKELCEWLEQMEKKVNHSSEHLSIEEMVEKLKKDCMEEINLFSENKSHLKQLGEQLLLASDRAKEAEIHGALRDVNDRWQHLFDHIEARVNKLKETMVTVQQLDKNMSNLRTWLSRTEAELAKPVHYSVCHGDEIQRRLAEQQDLQRDIEQHTEGVASVLTLCDVLLHDEDACSSDSENDSIQLTSRSLDQRWRNICSMSLERRMRIEETWRLWCTFQDDYSCFEDWLNLAERTAAEPHSSDVLYTVAKEELKRYEAFQREVHEKLTQLELINNQYIRLARESRTDTSSRLRAMVHKGNQRWESLQKRLAAILRRLRHFTIQREEFESTRESLLVWLTEMDLQLTNVEHFSESDIHQKLKQLNGFKKEITLNTNKIDALIVFGEGLIQRSSPLDAALIEDELEELHSYCQEVFSRVARFHQRLTSPRPMLLDEPELYGSEITAETEGSGLADVNINQVINQPPMCLLSLPQERSGRETPVSVDSIPLEWDHTGDVGGSSSQEDEDSSFFSGLSGVEVTESTEAFVKSTVKVLTPTSGEDVAVAQNWSIQHPERTSLNLDIPDTENPSPQHASTPYKHGYVQLMSKCSGSIESVRKVSLILNEEEQQEDQGLIGLTGANRPSGVIERWELQKALAVTEKQCSSKDPQKLTSDLHNITSWLGRVTPELEKLQKTETSVSVQLLEARVKQLKEMQKTFSRYKTLMLSLNLIGRELESEGTTEVQQLQEGLHNMNQGWTEACMGLESWEDCLRNSLMACQEFHETLHSLLLWLAHAESRRYAVNILDPTVLPSALREHRTALMGLEEELKSRQKRVGSLQEITSELLPESGTDDSFEAREKLHVTDMKLRLLLRQVKQDLQTVQEQLESSEATGVSKEQDSESSSKELAAVAGAGSRALTSSRVEKQDPSPQRSFFSRVLRAAFPLHLLFLLLLILACLVPLSEQDYSCTLSNNFARSFYPMLRYTNGPPPT
ncbi:nesprin-2 isoform X3 [Astyanax mexicanus]|uniref:nesprin-2 isoform X3 n=1 Tax=Astyanax mexicanus TaxID=7994 RepID=UPI0020CACEA0|nr:nesprin-2 isoform X3 [Astyanax mexicanus]